ncbi:MAG: hypothetical protein ACTSV9_01685 [Candidatus Thorarchaeota archaeon]
MNSNYDNSGFKKLIKRLETSPDTQKEYSSSEFMQQYTDFSSMDELIAASGFTPAQIRSFQTTTSAEWDQFICKNTKFDNWRQFIEKIMEKNLRELLPEFR